MKFKITYIELKANLLIETIPFEQWDSDFWNETTEEKKKNMNLSLLIVALVFIGLQVWMLISNLEHYRKSKQESKTNHEMAVKSLEADNLKEYLNCKLGKACYKLYPDAAATVLKAKEDAGVSTQ